MWNTVCSNRICFDMDKSREQILHLNRLLTIRPTLSATKEPIRPEFLKRRGPQIEKQKQIQTKIDVENNLVRRQIYEILTKPGKYCQRPTEVYPAFRRYGSWKYDDIIKFIKINESNIKLQNRINACRPHVDNEELRKNAYNQEKYLFNLLNRPKNIPISPALHFVSIDQIKNKIILYGQQNAYYNNLNKSKSQGGGTNSKRPSSAKKSNNSKTNKSNKSENKTNRSQSAKKQKSLRIEEENKNQNNNADIKENKKDFTTTKNTTGKY